jgi:zinc transport system substrate-binding protein
MFVGSGVAAEPAKAPSVLGAGISPVATLVQRIAGEDVTVQTLIASGQDPHTFEPTSKQIQEFGKIKIYFSVGLPFEEVLIEKIASAHGKIKVVGIADGVRQKLDTSHHHKHGPNCSCSQGNVDPHVWLSPKTLQQLARNIQKSLDEMDPAGKADREERCDALCNELNQLDEKLAEQLKPYRGKTVYVFHPSLGYFCQAYGLKQKAIETHGRTPTTRWLQSVIRQARSEGVKTIFVQKQFDRRAAKIVARAIEGKVEPIDPMAPDVIANLEHIGRVIVTSMGSKRTDNRGQKELLLQ